MLGTLAEKWVTAKLLEANSVLGDDPCAVPAVTPLDSQSHTASILQKAV